MNDSKQFSPLFAVGLLVWTVVVAITAIWWTIAIPRALRAARPKLNTLRVPGVVAAVVAVLLLAPAHQLGRGGRAVLSPSPRRRNLSGTGVDPVVAWGQTAARRGKQAPQGVDDRDLAPRRLYVGADFDVLERGADDGVQALLGERVAVSLGFPQVEVAQVPVRALDGDVCDQTVRWLIAERVHDAGVDGGVD